ncbi:uncharacterized protein LOC128782580 isoform X2 [Vidua chalybeata]|uniref:uncharacterized protein LOC128782580 isoform X2 n=1 Tax=Vidua chalybeata TaxID=81927 RepID=UPI0023A8C99D|nr:uncharacterized protein LOC128782580 isoform X2 [Vidua chalybeata]
MSVCRCDSLQQDMGARTRGDSAALAAGQHPKKTALPAAAPHSNPNSESTPERSRWDKAVTLTPGQRQNPQRTTGPPGERCDSLQQDMGARTRGDSAALAAGQHPKKTALPAAAPHSNPNSESTPERSRWDKAVTLTPGQRQNPQRTTGPPGER